MDVSNAQPATLSQVLPKGCKYRLEMYSFRRSRNIKLQIDSCMNTNHKHVQNTLFMTLELFKEGCLGSQQSSNSCLVSWLFLFVFSCDIIVNLHLCKDYRVHAEHIIAYIGRTLFSSHRPLVMAITILFYLRSNMSIFLFKGALHNDFIRPYPGKLKGNLQSCSVNLDSK